MSDAAKRVGLIGGSFDPPTVAHIQVAMEVLRTGAADLIWFVPCGARDDKKHVACPLDRSEMLKLTIKDLLPSSCAVEVCEKELKEGFLPSYTLLRKLQNQYPLKEFWLVIGSDLLWELDSWFEGFQLKRDSKFIVVPRGEAPPKEKSAFSSSSERTYMMPTTYVDLGEKCAERSSSFMSSNISSSEMRSRLEEECVRRQEKKRSKFGYTNSCAGFVTPSVLKYIEAKNLYYSSSLPLRNLSG